VAEKKVVEKTSSTLVLQEPRVASPIVSLEEITPCHKIARVVIKEKTRLELVFRKMLS